MLISCKLVVFFCLIIGLLADDRPIVKTKYGLIRGTFKTSKNGKAFTAFEGVPYAKPPIGKLRFRDPEPMTPWTGVWEANTVYKCLQLNHAPFNPEEPEGVEDCLYLNVYSPRLNDEEATMDVIVHIHGGAFMFGTAHYWGPDLLMDRDDVVYVNLNYRLGPLGFLSTEDEIVPGNMGLKDQNLALKWIKENIHEFGGNPESITVTGMSAGGASVHFHYLSPLSKDLFKQGISVSGTALCNWALVENPLKKARQLGSYVGCEQKTTFGLVQCMRQRNPKQIVKMVRKFQPWLYNPYSPFGPVVEPKTENGKQFLPDLPFNLIKQGKVADLPWLTSVTSEEGLYPAADFVLTEDRLPYLENHWTELAPYILHYDSTATPESYKEIAQKIKDFYLHGKKISKETYPELVQAIGDRLFVVDAEKAARLQARTNKSPVYFYYFTYRGGHSLSNFYAQSETNYGTSHADDFMYIIKPPSDWFKSYLKSKKDIDLSKIMIDMWTTFAKTGVPKLPNIKWPTVTKNPKEQFEYVHIAGPDNISIEKTDEFGHRQFWDTLPIKENDKNVITSKDEL